MFDSCFYNVNCIISICCKLIRCGTVICFLVCSCKSLCLFVFRICCKRSKKHYTFCQLSIIAQLAYNSVKSIASKEGYIKSRLVCLSKNKSSFFIIYRKEYQIRSAFFYF